jgi:hypothetical protein
VWTKPEAFRDLIIENLRIPVEDLIWPLEPVKRVFFCKQNEY